MCPADMAQCIKEYRVDHAFDASREHLDHTPVICRFQWYDVEQPKRGPPSYNRARLEDPEAVAHFGQLLEGHRPAAWHEDINPQIQRDTSFILTCAQKAFPFKAAS